MGGGGGQDTTAPTPAATVVELDEDDGDAESGRAGSEIWFAPEIHVSVVAHAAGEVPPSSAHVRPGRHTSGVISPTPAQQAETTGGGSGGGGGGEGVSHPPRLLLHGASVTAANVEALIAHVTTAARALEADRMAAAAAADGRLFDGPLAAGTLEGATTLVASSMYRGANSGARVAKPHPPSPPSITPLLEAAASVLKLLPSDAASSIVLVSDCVAGLPPCRDYGSLVMQLLRHDIAVNVLQVRARVCHVHFLCL